MERECDVVLSLSTFPKRSLKGFPRRDEIHRLLANTIEPSGSVVQKTRNMCPTVSRLNLTG